MNIEHKVERKTKHDNGNLTMRHLIMFDYIMVHTKSKLQQLPMICHQWLPILAVRCYEAV